MQFRLIVIFIAFPILGINEESSLKKAHPSGLSLQLRIGSPLVTELEKGTHDLEIRDVRTICDAETSTINRDHTVHFVFVNKELAGDDINFPYTRFPGILYKIMFTDKDYNLIGHIKFCIPDDNAKLEYCDLYGYIALLSVDSHHRGKGYGRALLHEAYKIFHEHGITKIALALWKGEHNIPAYNLYRSEGFVHDMDAPSTRYIMVKTPSMS